MALLAKLPLTSDLNDEMSGLTGGAVSRISAGTYIDTNGILKTAWGDRAQLINTSAQNDLTIWWSLIRASNSIAGGIIANTDNNTHYIIRTSLMAANTTYIFSLKAKQGAVDAVGLVLQDDLGAYSTYFNLSAGSVISSSMDHSGINVPDADGYYRCYGIITINTIASSNNVIIYASTVSGGTTFTGDDSSVSIYIKEIMLEALPSGNVIGDDLFDQETLGSELVTNGTFDTDTSGWTGSNATLSVVSGKLQVDATGNNGLAQQDVSLTAGKIYKLIVYFENVDADYGDIRLYDNTWLDRLDYDGSNLTATNTYTYYLRCIVTETHHIQLKAREGSGKTAFFDNVSLKEVTAPPKGIPENDPWAALAGTERITAQNDRDFSSETIGNWVVSADGSGTCAYSNADLDGKDDKQGLLTSSGDSYLYGFLSTTYISLTANTLYRCSVKVHVPAANTLKDARISWNALGDVIPSAKTSISLSDDTYTELVGYYYVAADITGDFAVGFDGNPADGDLLYFDDISIIPIQFSWAPQGTNTIEIDETEDALLITYVDDAEGADLYLKDSNDLTSDLTVGESYLVQFDAKVGSGDTVNMRIYDGVSTVIYTANVAESWTTYKLPFIAQHATNCAITPMNMGAGDIIYIRNLSIKPIPDIAMLEPSDYVNSATIAAKARFESNGLLIEGETTNLLLQSEDLTDSLWVETAGGANTSLTLNAIGPDGVANSAVTMTDDGTVTGAGVFQILASPLSSNLAYTFSVFVKEGTSANFTLQLYDQTATSSRIKIDFQWISGIAEVKTEDTGTGCVEFIGNGWYRVSGTVPVNQIIGGNEHRAIIQATEDGVAAGSSVTTLFFGPQLEQNLFMTSYLPTTTSPITRTSESADGTYGFEWSIASAVQTALANNGTLMIEYTPRYAAADGSGTGTCLITFEPSATGFVYYDFDNTDIEVNDSTNIVTIDRSLVNGTIYLIVARWHNINDDLNISEKHSGLWTHGTVGSFDDTIPHTGNKLYLHYGSEYPANFKNLYIFDQYISDINLEAEILLPTTVLTLLKISHDDITNLYFVNNQENIVSRGQIYIAYPFSINLPSDLEDQLPQVTLTIDNVSRTIVDEIRTLSGAPDIEISVILANNPDVIEAGPFQMKLRSVNYDFATITGTINEEDFFRESFPAETFSPKNFPGLFAGV